MVEAATSSPTQAPTEAPTDVPPAATYTPYPTYTPPPTYTPQATARAVGPIAPAVVVAATIAPPPQPVPELSEPAGGSLAGCVRFGWTVPPAAAAARARLLVCAGAGCAPRYAISSDAPPVVWSPRDTRGNPDLDGREGVYRWAVALDGLGVQSATQSFTWLGGACGDEPSRGDGGGEDPKNKPVPTPRP
jgi:hypothetical protein